MSRSYKYKVDYTFLYKSIEDAGKLIEKCDNISPGNNFKDHFIRHKRLLEKVTGKKYPKYKTDGQEFLNDVGKGTLEKSTTFQ